MPCIQIFYLAREHGAFGGYFYLLIVIVDSAAHFDGRAVGGVRMAHAAEGVEGIAPYNSHITSQGTE